MPEKNPQENIEVRDLRTHDWVWTSKKLLFSPVVDASMYKVYCGLSAYANNNTQKAFPGMITLTKKLHLSRNTISTSIKKMEAIEILKVNRDKGHVNIYYLLDIDKLKEDEPIDDGTPTPEYTTMEFFQGVYDLRNKIESDEATHIKEFLKNFVLNYPTASKEMLWEEIKKFQSYWTEKNKTGKKEKWQMQDTFEVGRRLGTWFENKKEFVKQKVENKNVKRIV